MVVLQALSEYLINKPPPDDLSLDVDIRITGRKEIRHHFNPNTAYVARSSRVRDVKTESVSRCFSFDVQKLNTAHSFMTPSCEFGGRVRI